MHLELFRDRVDSYGPIIYISVPGKTKLRQPYGLSQ